MSSRPTPACVIWANSYSEASVVQSRSTSSCIPSYPPSFRRSVVTPHTPTRACQRHSCCRPSCTGRGHGPISLRAQLFARLESGLQGVLTLVCAPAGFGKTTLLAAWLCQTPRPAAWLGLDAEDSDPTVFLRYLAAALQTLAPKVGAAMLTLLQSPQPPLETLLTALLNDVAELPQNSILVLDDYHALEAPSIHQAVGFLLDICRRRCTSLSPHARIRRCRSRGCAREGKSPSCAPTSCASPPTKPLSF